MTFHSAPHLDKVSAHRPWPNDLFEIQASDMVFQMLIWTKTTMTAYELGMFKVLSEKVSFDYRWLCKQL